jgi:hypothetical protein
MIFGSNRSNAKAEVALETRAVGEARDLVTGHDFSCAEINSTARGL